MRHTQSKLSNKSSDVSTNLKVSNTSSKCTGGSKRITSDPREQCAKKSRKSGVSELGNRKTTASHKLNADTEKTLRKYNPSVVKKTTLNLKRIKKPNEKYKQIGSRINRTQKTRKKIQKKVTKSFERNDDHEGPPTLCETFSRITTMVAETVINEKENQKLAESLLGKAKKETITADKPRRETTNSETGVGKSKGEPSSADTSASKIKRESQGCSESSQVKSKKELPKVSVDKRAKLVPLKAKDKVEKSKSSVKKGCAVKSAAVKALNEKQSTEPTAKAVKDDEVSVSGRGIATRRVSVPGSPESEKETESKVGSEKHKIISLGGTNGPVKNLNVTKALEKGKNDKKPALPVKAAGKRKDNNRTKSESKEKKPKINDSQLPIKKLVDEMSLDKDKEEDALQGCSHKKVSKNSKLSKNSKHLLKTNSETTKGHKKDNKLEGTATKNTRPKLGSETDGSNSDELTLSILQRKAKKCEKNESNSPKIKSEPGSPQDDSKAKAEEKADSSEKNSNDKNSKNKKIKAEKDDDDVPLEKKILEEILKKRRNKETESDTDEDLEFRRLLAKKLAKNIEGGSLPQMKRKRVEAGPSDSDQRARRLRLFGFWSGPKRHRVASLNALAKVHCLYENESKGVMAEIEKMGQILKSDTKKEKKSSRRSSKSVAKKDAEEMESEKLDSIVINKRRLRGTPGTRGAGKHWDMFPAEFTTSTSCASSDESHSDTDMSKGRPLPLPPSYRQKMQKKEESDKEETAKAPKRRRKTEIGATMDLKDMVVRKRMASLNASAILAASYSSEKRSNRKGSSGTSTEDGLSSPDEGRGDFLSADESDNSPSKKSGEKSVGNSDVDKSRESQSNDKDDNKRRKNFWKTKVENLKKSSKEKRNSPSPILADFAVGKDLCTTVLEKEKKDELNDDRERDKGNGSCKIKYGRKCLDTKSKCKSDAGNTKTGKGKESKKGSHKSGKEGGSHSRKNLTKRKLKDDELKNINIDSANSSEKNDEYEYKSDSDNGQRKLIELRNTGGSNKKVAVIVNQDTDVTITGVYVNSTRSTHHEGFCSIAGMQYRISSTSHTQTEATAVLKTSIASEQTPPPTEPTNCTSPRNHKSYTPLSALSNMQPPAGAPPHTHLPPPLPPPHHHHHHHHCGMGQHRPPHDKYLGHGPPHDQYLSHGPPQGPISPLGRRHGCSSAFSAPHCSSQPPSGRTSSPNREDDGFGPPMPSHGYFQPAGPLIHHQPANTTTKTHNIASIESNPASESQVTSSSNEDIVETTRIGENPPPPNPTHHIGYPRGYPPYQGYYQGGYYPPPQTSHYQTPPPPAFHHYHHHHQDLCYPPAYPTTTYPPPPTSYRRFLQPPPGYFTSEVTYTSSAPPTPQDPGNQQMIVPGGPSSSYSAPLDPYPPPAPYYAGYSGPSAACYTHPPSSRSLAFIEQTYQSCPCPVQSCPKNVHIGPLTGECKRPGALPLPPVALQLPQEPPGTAGPPSPARGSAGVAPLPSPMNNARPSHGQPFDGRQSRPSASADSRQGRAAAIDLRQGRPVPVDLRQARPAAADLRQAIPVAADLRQAIPVAADLRQAIPVAADLRQTIPAAADLRQTIPVAADLRQAIPVAADLRQAIHVAADLRQAIPVAADLRQAIPVAADLRQAIPVAADLRQAIPIAADLRQAIPAVFNLRHAIPVAADLRQAIPVAADLHQAIPLAADLRQAIPLAADLRQAIPVAADLRQARPAASHSRQASPEACHSRQASPEACHSRQTSPEASGSQQASSSVADYSSQDKWNGGKGKSEFKKKYKTEIACPPRKRLWNPAELMKPNSSKNLFAAHSCRGFESTSGGGNDDPYPNVFSHVQGLLAISSAGFPQIPLWPHNEDKEEIRVVDEVERSDTQEQRVSTEGSERESNQTTRKRKAFNEDLVKSRKRKKTEDEKRDVENQERIKEIVEKFEENLKKAEGCVDKEKAQDILKTEENLVKVEVVVEKVEKKQEEVKENGEKVDGVEEKGKVKEEKEQKKDDKEQKKDDKEQRKDDKEQKNEDNEQNKGDKEQTNKDKEQKGQMKDEKGQMKDEKGQMKDDKGKMKDDKGKMKDDKGKMRDDKGKMKDDKGKMRDDKGKMKDEKGKMKDEKRQMKEEEEGETKDEKGEKDKGEKFEEKETAKEKEKELKDQEGKVEEEGVQANEGEMASDDLLKRGKRKMETQDESPDIKERKSKKKFIASEKDEVESVAGASQRSSHKARLMKERHDTVAEVIEEVVKGRTYLRKESEKISGRRKSSQEKWSVAVTESRCTRRSRSCSPNRASKMEESRSPGRAAREEAKRRLSEYGSGRGSRAYGKCKLELRSKSSEKGSQEHSKTSKSSKRGSRTGTKATGKVSQGGSSSGVKSKKSSAASVNNPKKAVVPKEVPVCPKPASSPKWSNGWSWDSEPFNAKVYLTNDEPPVMRKCYSAMRHVEGDVIRPKDCVLLKSSPRKTDSPFIAKVSALWENPEDGEMMISLLWYYRPEHTDQVRDLCDGADEIFASRHKDTNSVACIEDKCFVLTYNEYCRYRKRVRQLEEGVPDKASVVPAWETPYPRLRRQPPCAMAPDLVFYCRRVYDFRQKRLLKNPA